MVDPRALDRQILYATAILRATATGMMGVGLGLYFAALGLSPQCGQRQIRVDMAGLGLRSSRPLRQCSIERGEQACR
jgi:hypothetical protein